MATKKNPLSWYEKAFEGADFSKYSPAARSFAGLDGSPAWVEKVVIEVTQQNMPTVVIKNVRVLTPEFVGKILGQLCANLYALGEIFNKSMENFDPTILEKNMALLQENLKVPGVSSLLQLYGVLGSLMGDLSGNGERLEKHVLRSFKAALDQPNYNEAVAFFRGFAKGLSKKGLSAKGLEKTTTATPIYQRMLFDWREVDKLESVPKLRDYLVKNGVPEAVIGDISRLRRLCTRIGYAPGKRGRPPKSKK